MQATGLDFRSTSYDWLLILDSRAVYHGTGTLNGAGSYGFTMSMTDGRPDRLRIKIWNKSNAALVYDNQPGAPDSLAPSMAIGGGSILVMKAPGGPKSVAPASSAPVAQAGLPLEYALSQNRPNPFVERTQIAFALPEPSHVRLTVYDAQGRVLAELANGMLQAGRHERTWDGRARDGHVAEPGVYFLRLEARSQASERRLETTRKLTLTR